MEPDDVHLRHVRLLDPELEPHFAQHLRRRLHDAVKVGGVRRNPVGVVDVRSGHRQVTSKPRCGPPIEEQLALGDVHGYAKGAHQ